jgi:hypothetical protein
MLQLLARSSAAQAMQPRHSLLACRSILQPCYTNLSSTLALPTLLAATTTRSWTANPQSWHASAAARQAAVSACLAVAWLAAASLQELGAQQIRSSSHGPGTRMHQSWCCRHAGLCRRRLSGPLSPEALQTTPCARAWGRLQCAAGKHWCCILLYTMMVPYPSGAAASAECSKQLCAPGPSLVSAPQGLSKAPPIRQLSWSA